MTPLPRRIWLVSLLLPGTVPVIAQDGGEAPAEAPPAEVIVEVTPGDDATGEPSPAAEETGADTSGDDEPVLDTDDESYLDIDEKDFTPSEEIPTDQSISFPVDI